MMASAVCFRGECSYDGAVGSCLSCHVIVHWPIRPCRDRPGCSLQSGKVNPDASPGIGLLGCAPWSPGWAHPDKPMPMTTISTESIIVFMANPSNAEVADRDSHHGRHLLVG
jgi:hypothetical protein